MPPPAVYPPLTPDRQALVLAELATVERIVIGKFFRSVPPRVRRDLAEVVPLAVVEAASRYDPAVASFRTYAVVWTRDYLRRYMSRVCRRDTHTQRGVPRDQGHPDRRVAPEDRVAPADRTAELTAAAAWAAAQTAAVLDGCPADVRTLLEMRFGVGRDRPARYAEIAAALGVTPSAVCRRFVRWVETLRARHRAKYRRPAAAA